VTLTSSADNTNWGPACSAGSSCKFNVGQASTYNVNVDCATLNPVGVTVQTGQLPGTIKFVKSGGSPYPAASLPFSVTISGANQVNLEFYWRNASKPDGAGATIPFPVGCGDVKLMTATAPATVVTGPVANGSYKLSFSQKCADNITGISQYNGIWDVPLNVTVSGDPKVYTANVKLDFSDSTHQ
jgi:hypothetical protein